MWHVLPVGDFDVAEEPALEQVDDFEIAVQIGVVLEAGLQIQDTLHQLLMLVDVDGGIGVFGFRKELLFIGVVVANVPDQLFKDAYELRLGTAGPDSVVYFIDEERDFSVVVVQQFHVDTHLVGPDDERGFG